LQGKIFTIANFFSFLRVLVIWPIVVQLQRGTPEANRMALYLMFFGVMTDFLDGFIARKLNQRSDVGRVVDPLADKIAVAAVSFTLWKTHGLPFWFFALLIGRDLAILLLAPLVMRKIRRIPESTWPGKIAVTAVAVVLILYTLDLSPWNRRALYASLIFLAASACSYIRRFYSVFFEKNEDHGI